MLTISGLTLLMSLSLSLVWGDTSAGRNAMPGWPTGQIWTLLAIVALMLYTSLSFLSNPEDACLFEHESIGEISPVLVGAAREVREATCAALPVPGPTAVAAKVTVEREQDKRIALLEAQFKQANEMFDAHDYEAALSLFNDMASGVLRWLDQERFRLVRCKQRDCLLGVAEQHAVAGRHTQAVRSSLLFSPHRRAAFHPKSLTSCLDVTGQVVL